MRITVGVLRHSAKPWNFATIEWLSKSTTRNVFRFIFCAMHSLVGQFGDYSRAKSTMKTPTTSNQARLFEYDDDSRIELWRPIHYLGSKLRIADQIADRLDKLSKGSGRVCDLFAGSGTVSLALSHDHSLISADIQEYSRVICSALLAKKDRFLLDVEMPRICEQATQKQLSLRELVAPLLELEEEALANASHNPSLLCEIVENGSIVASSATVNDRIREAKEKCEVCFNDGAVAEMLLATRYFGGVYFSYEQSLWIDCISEAMADYRPPSIDIGKAAVLSTASSIVNSIGKQFAQPLRPRKKDGAIKSNLVHRICRDRALNVCQLFQEWFQKYCLTRQHLDHIVVRGDYRDILDLYGSQCAVVYADPPYTRDHYSRFYHVLETLCLRDEPCVSARLPNGSGSFSRGIYRADRHQSPFCIKSQAAHAFEELLARTRQMSLPVLISYSPYMRGGHPRMLTIANMLDIAKRHYRQVSVESVVGIKHSKLNASSRHLAVPEDGEVLIECDMALSQ